MKNFFNQQYFYYYLTLLTLSLSLIFPLQLLAADEAEGGAAVDEATYFELTPAFVVNLQDSGKRIRFLQVRIQVLAYGAPKIEKVKAHDPALRDALITLLSSQSQADINTSQKKKALQESALKVAQDILKTETGESQIEGLYFTTFVVQ